MGMTAVRRGARTISGASGTLGPSRLIGNTPLIPLPLPGARRGVHVLVKAEWLNPGGSVKDRAALAIVEAAERAGELPGKRLLDASSGNTAIAYGMLGAERGYGVTICLPANASMERKAILRAHAVEVIETDAAEGSDGAIRHARELVGREPTRYFYADQYNNPANADAHYASTGPEIWRHTGGRITHLVCGLGTTGTLMGTGRYLRERSPHIQLIAVEPDDGFHGIEGLKHLPTAILPGLYDPSLVDRTVRVRTEAAYEMTRWLARERGLLVGPSSGAAAYATKKLVGAIEEGCVVVVFPDGGQRYLSLPIWENAG
jgi:cysteine synthase B